MPDMRLGKISWIVVSCFVTSMLGIAVWILARCIRGGLRDLLLGFGIVGFLLGCHQKQTVVQQQQQPASRYADVPPAPAPVALPAPSVASPPPLPFEKAPARLIPTRSYLRAADIPPPVVAAYGVVALRSRPTDVDRNRLSKVCEGFKSHLPRQESLPASVSPEQQMVTVWPVDDPTRQEVQKEDCSYLLDHYDLYGGISAISDATRQHADLMGRGPFLIGWSPSRMRGVPDAVVLVIDMSSFDSQESFNSAFLFWQRKVVEDPALWRSGFLLESLRLAVRDFVDHYGDAILSAVKLWNAKG